MNRFRFLFGLALLSLLLCGGCTSYYSIQDASSEKVYYTTKYKQHADGAVEFKDAVTDQTMNLKNVGIHQMDKGEWENSMERLKAQQPPGNKS